MFSLFILKQGNGVVWGMRKTLDKRILSLLVVLSVLIVLNLLIGMAGEAAAGTAQNLPWETPLQKISDSLTGPVARALCLIMVVVSVGVLVFGGDLSGWARSVAFMALAAGILGGATSFIAMAGVDGALIL